MRWKKILKDRAKVHLAENDPETFERLMGNCADNGFQVLSTTAADCERTDSEDDDGGHGPDSIIAFNEDCNVVMLLRGYDFIHLDPFGSTVQHLDAAFRNIRHGGVVVLTSTDTGSLFGKVPTVAKRNYDAFVTKTEYFRELAARMVLAAAARSAAKCNKGFQVLYVVAMEHFVQAAVRICRGAQPADKTVEKVAKVVHCLVCEERSVLPNSNHPVDAAECLVCDCSSSATSTKSNNSQSLQHHQQQQQQHHQQQQQQTRGRNRILLGPVWCGSIYEAQFVEKMEKIAGPQDIVGRKQREAARKKEEAERKKEEAERKKEAIQKEAQQKEVVKTEQKDIKTEQKDIKIEQKDIKIEQKDLKTEPQNDADEESFIGKIAFSPKTREILHLLKLEAVCASSSSSSSSDSANPDDDVKPKMDVDEKTPCKKRRISGTGISTDNVAADGATTEAGANGRVSPNASSTDGLRQLSDGDPLFYYSTHVHLPKDMELLKVDRLVELLRKEGHRASRTHFDTVSVRTTATASHIKKLAQQYRQPPHLPRKRIPWTSSS